MRGFGTQIEDPNKVDDYSITVKVWKGNI